MKADITRAHIEASKFIDHYSFETPEDIRIEDIAMDQGLIVREGIIKGAEARLIQNGENGIVTINATDDPRRKRFAIAHELGHWKMHRDNKFSRLCYNDDLMAVSEEGSNETEANIFASEVLMPRNLFFPMCRSLEPNIAVIKKLSSVFDTSFTATALRFIDATMENCFLVNSKDLKVVWWKKNKSRLFIERQHELKSKTMAFNCVKNNLEETPMKKVFYDSWFSDVPEKIKVSLSEQAIRLGNSTSVLSLLWVFEDEIDSSDFDS
jgi:Zn-dependent peptidase ImmA (M78 family)